MQHLQLADDLVPDGRFDLQVDELEGRVFIKIEKDGGTEVLAF